VYGIDMPIRTELVAYGRNTEEIATAIGADLVIFQKLADLISSVRQLNPSITSFDCSVFTGEYVTGGVDETYLQYLESSRAETVKGRTIVGGIGAMEGRGGRGTVPNGVYAEREMQPEVNGQMNGADNTVGLHNSWKVSGRLSFFP
jgi:amidophosphoribosyltransferase